MMVPQGTCIVLKITHHSNLGMPFLESSQSPPDSGIDNKQLKLGCVPGSLCTSKVGWRPWEEEGSQLGHAVVRE